MKRKSKNQAKINQISETTLLFTWPKGLTFEQHKAETKWATQLGANFWARSDNFSSQPTVRFGV